MPDTHIQSQLLQWVRNVSTSNASDNRPQLAERCLLCFISWQIEQVCLRLEAQFGTFHRFSCHELLPFVLNDDGRLRPSSYQSFAREILQSFDPRQGSLTTWTIRKVKQHPELSAFLLEQGVYLVSDWAILNDTRPKQLERILREFHQLTSTEIKQASQLLDSYHAVYRAKRVQERRDRSKRQCTPPTTQHLQEIAHRLAAQTEVETLPAKLLLPETVMAQLQKMASRMRQYRIYVRGGGLPTESLDINVDDEHRSRLDIILAPENPHYLENQDEQIEFLKFYRQQFVDCLDLVVAQVTDSWMRKLQRKNAQKAEQFFMALYLFHCQEQSMGEIAEQVRLKAQFQVSRLLRLKELRADVRQQMLVMLRDRILERAKYYNDLERLHTLEQQIEEPLNEQITAHMSKNGLTSSLFAQRLCRYLDTRRS